MQLKVLALGGKNMVRRVANSLAGSDIELVCFSDISSAIDVLKKEKFDLVLADGYMNNLETTCYRISLQCRVPVVLIINGTQTDWDILRSIEADGFIPEEAGNMELMAYFTSIAGRKNSQSDGICLNPVSN